LRLIATKWGFSGDLFAGIQGILYLCGAFNKTFIMATTYLTLSRKDDGNPKKEIRLRFKHGKIDQQAKTNIYVPADNWDDKAGQITIPNPRLITAEKKELINFLTEQNEKIYELLSVIQKSFNEADKNNISSDWLKTVIDKHNFPDKDEAQREQSFFDVFSEYLRVKNLSTTRRKHYDVVVRALRRFEAYTQRTKDKSFMLEFETVTPVILSDFENFLKNEHVIHRQYPEIYELVPESKTPKSRGKNTINGILGKVRTVFIWAVDNEKTANNPFRKFSIEQCVYGTPIYITVDERNILYKTDFSHLPELETQRDIFVFQCVIGCRVSDLFRLTKKNIINGAIEYIGHKTRNERPRTIRVPLNMVAREILDKYANFEDNTLLPFTYLEAYNISLKKIFKIAGLTREVVTVDTLTREQVTKPLDEIASSHLARRTFIGNAYAKTKDPNQVGAISGHKEGSRSFFRYRDISENDKIELVKMLE